jgi:hypothetical protein
MPTELGEPFDITWRGTPEQMLPADVPLWHAYLDRAAGQYKQFYYNVKVGGPDLTNVVADEGMKKMYYQATAKRIDVLAEKESSLEIIEVASSPYLRAVGQCLSYAFLWNLDRKINKPAKMVLLCWYLDFDLESVLKAHQVEVIQLTPQR